MFLCSSLFPQNSYFEFFICKIIRFHVFEIFIEGLLSFDDDMFSWFFMFLVILCCCFAFELKTPQLFTSCLQMGYFVRWSCCIWDSLWPCIYIPALHFLLPLVAEFLSFYAFSGSYSSPDWLLETSLLFSRRWCYSSSLWFPLAYRSRSVFLRALHFT